MVRSIILARLLAVELFGIYGLALAIVSVSVRFSSFGMDGAFLNRVDETEDIEKAASVHFSLICLFTAVWALFLLSGSFFLSEGDLRIALMTLVVVFGLMQLTETPKLILRRKVVHQRLAVINIIDAVFGSLAAVFLAQQGYGILSLLSINIFSLAVFILVLYLYKPVWKIRIGWSVKTVKYYLNFGFQSFLGGILFEIIDRVDDIWTGIFLGDRALGFYSRAYSFATYPTKLLADPINRVALGYYADLKAKKQQLSQAFLLSNGVLVRSGFLFGGLLALIAPEFIVIVIGEKWMPMLSIFRLMLFFTLLNPLKITTSHLFVGVGKPLEMVRARMLQVLVLIGGLFLFGPRWETDGIAMAVNLTIVVGLGYMMVRAKRYVSFSIKKLFLAPMIALVFGLIGGFWVSSEWYVGQVNIISGLIKSITFTGLYAAILLLLEKSVTIQMFQILFKRDVIKENSSDKTGLQ